MSKEFTLEKEETRTIRYLPEGSITPPAISFLSYERHIDLVSNLCSEYLNIHIALSEREEKDYECLRAEGEMSVTDEKDEPAMDSLKTNLKKISPNILEKILSQIDSEARTMLKAILE